MDLFDIVWNALSPYAFSILRLALSITLFSNAIKIIRQKGGTISGNNPWAGIWTAFLGYLLGRGIPIIIGVTDQICNDILNRLP